MRLHSLFVLLVQGWLSQVSAFCPLHRQAGRTLDTFQLHAIQNEFSRTMQPERVLRSRKDYSLTIDATPEECTKLAKRFDLSDIARLSAELSIRADKVGSSKSDGLEVEGTVYATVTQRCVRTNEDFQVNIEFPLYSIVRPVVPIFSDRRNDEEEELLRAAGLAPKQKSNNRNSSKNLGEMDMMALQRMLQQDISEEDDVLMEDEAIYPLDGLLDVGELVSQLFWLELDPYPKKPGTDPMSASITG